METILIPTNGLIKVLDLPKFREFKRILGIETVKEKKSSKWKLQVFDKYKDFKENGIDL